jgi:hypothetical protein
VVPTLPALGLNIPFPAWKRTLGLDFRRQTKMGTTVALRLHGFPLRIDQANLQVYKYSVSNIKKYSLV